MGHPQDGPVGRATFGLEAAHQGCPFGSAPGEKGAAPSDLSVGHGAARLTP